MPGDEHVDAGVVRDVANADRDLPGEDDRMSAMAIVSRDHDATGVHACGLHQAGDQVGADARDIAGREQHAGGPRIGVEHREAQLDRVAHLGGLEFGDQHLGPGPGGLGGDRSGLGRSRPV